MIKRLMDNPDNNLDSFIFYNNYHNFYVNLFNTLLLMDCNNINKDVTVLYNGINIYYSKDEHKIEDFIDYINIIENNSDKYKIIDNDKFFNPYNCIFNINHSTLNLLINSNALTLDSEYNYDIIAKNLNNLILLAQKNLEKYLKNSVKSKYSIYDLYNEYILSYYGKESNKVKERIYINIGDYIYCNYDEVFKIYLDNLKLITLYGKYLTKFQIEFNSNILVNDKIKEYINTLGIFPFSYIQNSENFYTDINTIKNTTYIKNGSQFNYLYTKNNFYSDRYNKCNNKDNKNFYINTMYSIPNSIFNLFSNLDTINRVIEKENEFIKKIVLYKPKFNNLSKSSKTQYLISKIIMDANEISNDIDEFKNRVIGLKESNIQYRSYGDILKYSSNDSDESFIIKKLRFNILDTYNTSIFKGYIQNDKYYTFSNKVKYNSSVWLKPLYKNDLLISRAFNPHLVRTYIPHSYFYRRYSSSKNDDPKKFITDNTYNAIDVLNHYLPTGNYFTIDIMNNNTAFLELHNSKNIFEIVTNDLNRDNSLNNTTSYVVSLSSIFMLRSYMIGILEMISRSIKDSLLKELDNKQLKKFMEAYKINNSYNLITMVSDYKNNTKCIDLTYCNEMRYSKYSYIYDLTLTSSDLPVKRDRYIRSFYSFFIDSFNLNELMLEKMSTIAKEDYLTCPMM